MGANMIIINRRQYLRAVQEEFALLTPLVDDIQLLRFVRPNTKGGKDKL